MTNPPPSSGGVLISHTLGVLEDVELALDPSDPQALALTAAALRSAVALRTPAFERALYRGGARSCRDRPARAIARGRGARRARHEPHQRRRRGRRRGLDDLLDRLRVGCRRGRYRRPSQQHARRARPAGAGAAAPARRQAHEHDGAVAGAGRRTACNSYSARRGRRASGRPSCRSRYTHRGADSTLPTPCVSRACTPRETCSTSKAASRTARPRPSRRPASGFSAGRD